MNTLASLEHAPGCGMAEEAAVHQSRDKAEARAGYSVSAPWGNPCWVAVLSGQIGVTDSSLTACSADIPKGRPTLCPSVCLHSTWPNYGWELARFLLSQTCSQDSLCCSGTTVCGHLGVSIVTREVLNQKAQLVHSYLSFVPLPLSFPQHPTAQPLC